VEVLASPTLAGFPPAREEGEAILELLRTMELNLAGVPALAQPIRGGSGPIPPSLQLYGPRLSEELLLATGARIESVAGAPACR
jgi:Asp-tRNA(Asn)/Glu-tRNA(Gln) amidotransferase A subunit family amidase